MAIDSLYAAGICPLSNATLRIENQNTVAETVSVRSLYFSEGSHHPLPALARISFPLGEVPYMAEAPSTAFEVVRSSKKVKVEIFCQGLHTAPSGTLSPRQYIDLPKRTMHVALVLLNLHHTQQTFQIFGIEGSGQRTLLTKTHLTNRYEESRTTINTHQPYFVRVEIIGEGRFTASAIMGDDELGRRSDQAQRVLMAKGVAVESTPELATSYFLVSHYTGDQNYVLPIKDPVLADQARQLLRTGYQKIVSAAIRPSSSWTNRDFVGDSAPWSWEVSELYGFNDFGSVTCDGSPLMLESLILIWNKPICFWSYHLSRELSAAEVRSGHLWLGALTPRTPSKRPGREFPQR